MKRRSIDITIKKMESDDEIRGKAYVHWKSWHEAYSGIVNQEYLDRLTLEKCEKIAFNWPDDIIIAKDGDSVIGFVSFGGYRNDADENAGEVFAIYILAEYYGQGIGCRLMQEALSQLTAYHKVMVWVLKDNKRAIRFYEKCGFHIDGQEETICLVTPITEVRMVLMK